MPNRQIIGRASLVIVGFVTSVLLAGCVRMTSTVISPALVKAEPMQLQLAVYAITLPTPRSAEFGQAIADGKNTQVDFEKSLQVFGLPRLISQFDQSVDLAKDQITSGQRVPFVTSSRKTDTGRVANTVSYENVGTHIGLSSAESPKGLVTRMEVELSDVIDSQTEISEGLKAVKISTSRLVYSGPIVPDKPIVLLSMGTAGSAADQAGAYVCRAVFRRMAP